MEILHCISHKIARIIMLKNYASYSERVPNGKKMTTFPIINFHNKIVFVPVNFYDRYIIIVLMRKSQIFSFLSISIVFFTVMRVCFFKLSSSVESINLGQTIAISMNQSGFFPEFFDLPLLIAISMFLVYYLMACCKV